MATVQDLWTEPLPQVTVLAFPFFVPTQSLPRAVREGRLLTPGLPAGLWRLSIHPAYCWPVACGLGRMGLTAALSPSESQCQGPGQSTLTHQPQKAVEVALLGRTQASGLPCSHALLSPVHKSYLGKLALKQTEPGKGRPFPPGANADTSGLPPSPLPPYPACQGGMTDRTDHLPARAPSKSSQQEPRPEGCTVQGPQTCRVPLRLDVTFFV